MPDFSSYSLPGHWSPRQAIRNPRRVVPRDCRHRKYRSNQKGIHVIGNKGNPRTDTMRNTVPCTPRTACPAQRPRRASLRTRALVAAAATLLLATMVYGETWLLGDPAPPCVECAVTRNVARVLDGDVAAAPDEGAEKQPHPRAVSAGT